MKTMPIITVLFIALVISSTASASEKEPTEVSSINAYDVESSYGYTTVSLKAEICNNNIPAKIFVTIKGLNWSGSELADIMFDSIVLDKDECRTVTDTRMIKTNIKNDIREWRVKKIRRYDP